MKSHPSRPILSSICIEPVDSDDYNQSLVEQLTPYHKRTFLPYVKIKPTFLSDVIAPDSYPKLCERLVNELNKEYLKCNRNEWLSILKAWAEFVSSAPTGSKTLTTEDNELLKCMNHIKVMDVIVLVCCIAVLVVDAVPAKAIQQVKHISSATKSTSKGIEDFSAHCRICLASSSSKMLYLFEEKGQSCHEEVSLLDKLNYCSCFTTKASADDHLPQYICMSCSILVENAYQLKILCGKTEEKFHEIFEKVDQHIDLETETCDPNENIQLEIVEHGNILSDAMNGDQEIEIDLPINEAESRREEDILETVDDSEEVQIVNIKSKSLRSYRCDVCTAVFSSKRSVCDHMKQNHKGYVIKKKLYKCPECEKWFRVKCSLTIHMRTHTGERPYYCEICFKAFKTSSAVNNHRVIHTEAKDFKCSTCSFSTNTKGNLRIHERIHSDVYPYACQFCTMKFRTASNMVKHMRNIHEKEKANKCDKCSRSFFTRESLRKHSIVHTRLKPFYCPHVECSQSYGWYNGLKKHIRHQHASENLILPSEKFFFDKIKDILP